MGMRAPKYHEKLNCFQNVIAHIASREGRFYEWMLADQYSFLFESGKGKTLGERIHSNADEDLVLLEQLHGIRVEQYKGPIDLALLIHADSRHHYICVLVDTYDCPWDVNYQIHHNPGHALLLLEFDEDHKAFWVADPFYQKNVMVEQYELLHAVKFCFFIDLVSPKMQETIDLARILLRKKIVDTAPQIEEIKCFAKEMRQVDFEQEMGNTQNPWHTPLVFQMGRLALARQSYSVLLRWLELRYSIGLEGSAEMLDDLIILWNGIRGRLATSMMENRLNQRGAISERLMVLYQKEVQFVDRMIEHLA